MTAFRARRLPIHRGPAGWSAILPPRAPGPVLEGAHSADVVVVGGGFAGLSAARRLRQLQPGARIAVLEAGEIAQGAAGRNSGFMIDLPHDLQSEDYAGAGDDRAAIALNRMAQAFGADAVEEYAVDPAFFDRAGKVNGAVSATAQAHNAAYARHLSELGEPHDLLDAAQMRDLTGSGHYKAGLFTPGTVMLQPAGYIRGLSAGLARDGVAVFENSPVTGFSRDGAAWRVKTLRGSIGADRVILCVNGHLESFGIRPGRLMHLFLFAAMTARLDKGMLAGRPRWGITPSDPMGTTVRRIDGPLGGDRVLVRTCAVLRSGMESRTGDLARAKRVMRGKLDALFPALAGVPIEHAWAGHLCLSKNGVAVMRKVEDGVFSACVQNGLGTVRGTLTGIGAAELACGHDSAITRHFLAEAEPVRLPPPPFRDIGANMYLRWKERQARDE